MGLDLGRSDDEVGHAIWEMKDAINAMIDATTMTGARGAEVDAISRDDLTVSMSLDPKKIQEEFDRLRKAAFRVGEDPEPVVWVNEAKHKLDGWRGPAADAFRRHLDRITEFVRETQNQAILNGLQALGALFVLAYRMREDYYNLAKTVTSCANHEIDQERVRDNKAKLAITKELVKTLLAINPAGAVEAGLEFFVEVGATFAEEEIEGTGTDAVIDEYRRLSTTLRESYEFELNQLTAKLQGDWKTQVDNEAHLTVMRPLPSYMDVSSPDFNYAAFWTEEYPKDGPFGAQVAAERERYAQEEEAEETEINKRLEGQD
jgi:hypothetical protein